MKWTNPYLVKAKNYDSKRFTTDFGTEIESAMLFVGHSMAL